MTSRGHQKPHTDLRDESDTADMIQYDMSAKRTRNLAALQKVDPNVLEIVAEASHTALYRFDAALTKWERHGVEGAVFITRNCLAPFYSIIVLNKVGPDDFLLDVSAVQKAKTQDEYVMLRYTTGGAPVIMGLWLRDAAERDELLAAVTRAIATAKETSARAAAGGGAPMFSSTLTMKLAAAAQKVAQEKEAAKPKPPPSSYAAAVGGGATAVSPQPAPTPVTPVAPVAPAALLKDAGAKILNLLQSSSTSSAAATATKAINTNSGAFLTDREISSSKGATSSASTGAGGSGPSAAVRLMSALNVGTAPAAAAAAAQAEPPAPSSPTARMVPIPLASLWASASATAGAASAQPQPQPLPPPPQSQSQLQLHPDTTASSPSKAPRAASSAFLVPGQVRVGPPDGVVLYRERRGSHTITQTHPYVVPFPLAWAGATQKSRHQETGE